MTLKLAGLVCLSFFLLHNSFLTAQISFADSTHLLLDTTVYSGVVMAVADMNGDGLDDIIRLEGGSNLQVEYQSAAGGNFTSLNYGYVNGRAWGLAIADVDENGFNDLLIGGRYNGLKLLTANNNGTNFTQSDIGGPSIFLQAVNFADINNDGNIDIFACHDDGISSPYVGDGAGNFTHNLSLINTASPTASDNSGNYGTVWTDYDGDGDLDLYLSKCRIGVSDVNDGRRKNLLFENDGNGNYSDVAASVGLQPLEQSWAADFVDLDNDEDLDAVIVHHSSESQIFINDGTGNFSDATDSTTILPELINLGAGIQVISKDYNNDQFIDIFITSTNGQHKLFQNNGDFTFSTINNPFPTGGENIHSAAVGDLNNDGFLDVYAGFATGYNAPSNTNADKLFINQGNSNNHLIVNLEGVAANKNGVGARVELKGSWGTMIREIRAGESYGITNTINAHFGLGTATTIDSLIVKWPNGTVDKLTNVPINQSLTMIEGQLLPVELTDFQVLAQSNFEVLLTWETARERDNNFFEIQRSENGINFRSIGKVNGKGHSDLSENYYLIDRQPVAGKNYYRLKQVDFDGSWEYSEIRTVQLTSLAENIRISPNPAVSTIRIDLHLANDQQRFQVRNQRGEKVIENIQINGKQKDIDISLLADGLYFLEVISNGKIATKKFLKIGDF